MSGRAEKPPRAGKENERPYARALQPPPPKEKKELKPVVAAAEADRFINDLLGDWEGVPVDAARRAFEKLNGWDAGRGHVLRSRFVDMRAWYRDKFERMLLERSALRAVYAQNLEEVRVQVGALGPRAAARRRPAPGRPRGATRAGERFASTGRRAARAL